MFLKSVVGLVSLSLIVIFQPELRRFLGYLGQADFISKFFGNSSTVVDQRIDILKELIEAVKLLSKSHMLNVVYGVL
jgi:DNA integrity scanning protein DisA with diadenylate cyclase activity